jgi:beta-lactamase regulating signal transducer with metallopeptidase domain
MRTFTGMERFFEWLLQTTGQAAVVTVIILLAQFLLRRRLSPAWRYGLWFLLLARLLMPITPRSALSVFNLAKWTPPPAALATPMPAPVPEVRPTVSAPSEPHYVADVQAVTEPLVGTASIPEPGFTRGMPTAPVTTVAFSPVKAPPWMLFATAAWFSGVLILTMRSLWLNHRFRRRLAGYMPVSNESVRGLTQECAKLLHLKANLTIIETAEVDSPAVYGLWHKRLLLPEGLRQQLTAEELRHVLLHELAHIKRRDPELNWLMTVLHLLHWFNPVLWFAFARMRADRELATDELALAHTRQRDRNCYGETVLKVLEQLTQRRALPGLVGIGESKAEIKQRLQAIARGSFEPRWRWAAGGAAVVIAGVALTNARQESPTEGLDLLAKYPTRLTAADVSPARARSWQFTEDDIVQVSRFTLEVGKQLRVEAAISDLGIGHCADGAVWAVLIPRQEGKLTCPVAANPEPIAHLWLRFHPAQISAIFPPSTVSAGGRIDLEDRMRRIAQAKMHSSWQAGNRATIPGPKEMTVDADTKDGPRRFFAVNRDAETAQYVAAFAGQSVRSPGQTAYELELDPNCARVVSVSPPDGAEDAEPKQEIHIRFDRAMKPQLFKLEWLAGGFQLNGSIRVQDDQREFIIPVRLTPGQEQKLVINRDFEREMWINTGKRPEMKPRRGLQPRGGFLDADSVAANEFRWSFRTKNAPAKPGARKPSVVSVSPASGATTPILTLVEITFDQPMRLPDLMLPYLQKRQFSQTPNLIPSFDYDPAAHRFTFPALLPLDDDTRLTIRGFASADGVACDPVVLHYQTGAEGLDAKYVARAQAATKDPQLQKLLASMREARARLNSGIETVQSIHLNALKTPFDVLEAQTATFKWQGAERAYADITGPMAMTRAFILGCDGQTCWLYSVSEQGEKRLEQCPATTTQRELLFLDPFSLAKRPIQEALEELSLVYAGRANLEGRPCHRVEKWDVNQDMMAHAVKTQWWIDAESFLLKQIIQVHPNGCQILRFDYHDLNQPIPDSAFQPPVKPGEDPKPSILRELPTPEERRFLHISDGSNGRMSGRIGFRGPNGTTSSGMN